MKNLTAGVPLLKKQIGHQTPGTHSWQDLSCVDIEKANEAATLVKPKSAVFCSFSKQRPRDEVMLRQDDRYENLQNYYTRERREFEIKALSTRNRWVKQYF